MYVGSSGDPGGEACRLRDVGTSCGGNARLRGASAVRVTVPTSSGMCVSQLSSILELSVTRMDARTTLSRTFVLILIFVVLTTVSITIASV